MLHLRGQEEGKVPGISGRRWKIPVSDENSRGKLSAAMGSRGFANKMWECHTGMMMFAISLPEDAATAMTLSGVANWLCCDEAAACIWQAHWSDEH